MINKNGKLFIIKPIYPRKFRDTVAFVSRYISPYAAVDSLTLMLLRILMIESPIETFINGNSSIAEITVVLFIGIIIANNANAIYITAVLCNTVVAISNKILNKIWGESFFCGKVDVNNIIPKYNVPKANEFRR